MAQSLTTLQSTALGPVLTVSGVSPTVAIITTAYPGSATAADPAGGETITITGTGFNAGVKVYVGSTICTTTYVSATSLTFVSPANSVGSYVVYVYNTDGTNGVNPAGITYSAIPVWVTASGALPGGSQNAAYSTSVSATGDNITYSVTTGSLPTGLSLNASTGAITGTPTVLATSTFSITATDAQNQKVARSFSIAVTSVVSAVEYLVVAGGASGGGGTGGGGGGAGGYKTATGFAVSTGISYTVTIGAGGANVAYGANGNPGSDSVFSTITSLGGGYGAFGTIGTQVGGSGGSGGGGGSGPTSGALGSAGGSGTAGPPRQGYDGGRGAQVSGRHQQGGGGGGAGGIGGNADITGTGPAGDGGIAIYSSISSANVSYSGGGGGGGHYIGTTRGGYGGGTTPATGGGGNGANQDTPGTVGSVNTGGGGGGGGNGGAGGPGQAGGSGIVILRYADNYPAAASTTGSPTVTVTGGYRIYKFTGSGSITF